MFCLELIIIPKSSVNKLIQEEQGLKLKITAPPVDGEANKKIIEYLAKIFSCPKSTVILTSGKKSRYKRFCFQQLTQEQGQKQLEEILIGR